MSAGYVYILVNAAMPGLVKIGKTTGSPKKRARELSAVTGVPGQFVVAHAEYVPDCGAAERIMHKRFASYRYDKRREFFRVHLGDAILALKEIAKELRGVAPEATLPPPTAPAPAPAPSSRTAESDDDSELDHIRARRRQKEQQTKQAFLAVVIALALLSCCGGTYIATAYSARVKDSSPSDKHPKTNQQVPPNSKIR